MNPKTRYTLVLLMIALFALTLTACGTDTQTAAPAANNAPASLTETSLNMAWIHEYSASYLYTAEANHHFANNGLAVSIKEGGFGPDGYIEPIAEVVSGNSDFGIAGGPALIQARASGQPVVALMAFLQRTPDSLISLSDENITRPEDLVGHTVSVTGGSGLAIYQAFLAQTGVDPEQVNTVERTDFGVDPLLNGDVDVIYGWLINEAVLVSEAGQEPNVILISDYGVDLYANVLFATEDTIANRPELVDAMVRSLTAGLSDVVADPDAAIDLTLTYNDTLDRDAQLRRLEAMIPLINPAGSKVGTMDPEIWQLTYDALEAQGLLETPFEISDMYTSEFLDHVYNTN